MGAGYSIWRWKVVAGIGYLSWLSCIGMVVALELLYDAVWLGLGVALSGILTGLICGLE